MIVEGKDAEGHTRSDCMGYAAFVSCLDDASSPVGPWFARLRSSVDNLIQDPGRPPRLLDLQHLLIEFIEEVDPRKVRFAKDRSRA
jgi:hypothetical protein